MSEAATVEQDGQMTLEERLEGHKKVLVEWGDEIGERAKRNRDWKSQARVLLDAASRESEPKVLRNLLRYQSTRNPNWVKPYRVVDEVYRRMNECEDRAGGDRKLAMEMIRHLLLYALRSFTYHEAEEKAKQKRGKPKKGGRRG